MNVIEKLVFIRKQMGYSQSEFAKKIARTTDLIKNIESGRTSPKKDLLQAVSDFTRIPLHDIEYGLINTSSIIFTKETEHMALIPKMKIIPLYDNVASIGGRRMEADGNDNVNIEYINAGDWFPGATAAIRHYDDSMKEYPSGCILPLKPITDFVHGFILGRNYVVEYGLDWNRVTKRIQRKGKTIMEQQEKLFDYDLDIEYDCFCKSS